MQKDQVHTETLKLIRQITLDGEITTEEVWDLATFFNDNLDSQKYWPGSVLWKHVQQIFSDNVVTVAEMDLLGQRLRGIEKVCETVSTEDIPGDFADTYKLLEETEITLPLTNKTILIEGRGEAKPQYLADLRSHSCDCQDWFQRRKDLPKRSPGRMCKHLVQAFGMSQPTEDDEEEPWPKPFVQLIQGLLDGVIDPAAARHWRKLVWGEISCIVAWGDSEWGSIYQRDRQGNFERFGYNRTERRWAYGEVADNFAFIRKYLETVE